MYCFARMEAGFLVVFFELSGRKMARLSIPPFFIVMGTLNSICWARTPTPSKQLSGHDTSYRFDFLVFWFCWLSISSSCVGMVQKIIRCPKPSHPRQQNKVNCNRDPAIAVELNQQFLVSGKSNWWIVECLGRNDGHSHGFAHSSRRRITAVH